MTAWILTIAKEHSNHLKFALEDGFWDMRRSCGVTRGDDVYFWQSGGSFVAWVRATSDVYPITAGNKSARWHDVGTGGYQARFDLEFVSERLVRAVRWSEMQRDTSITALARNAQIEVSEPADGQYLRNLFRT